MTKDFIVSKFKGSKELQNKLKVLKLASEINPKFKNPNICGGYLRDIILDRTASDCDVVFDGYMKNQPDILECVVEAEKKLGLEHYPHWEFENFNVSGVTGNMFEDVIGFYSNHTDYLTLLLCDVENNVQVGSEITLKCLEQKIYDIRYQGLMVWMGFRDRSYFRSVAGLACRGMYLCHKLDLNPSESAQALFFQFENNFGKLTEDEKESLISYWNKKTLGLKDVVTTLRKFNVTNLK